MDEWKSYLKSDPIPWLLESNPWTRHRTLTELQDYKSTDPPVLEAKKNLTKHEQVRQLAGETKDWILVAPTRNNDARISYFKLRILADFGLSGEDLDLERTIDKASEHMLENMFAVRGTVPEPLPKGQKYEKPDLKADVWHVSPCNSPAISAALLGLGVKDDRLDAAVGELMKRWTDEVGWFCHFFFVESQHKKLGVGCPIAGLMALDVFSRIPSLKESEYSRNAYAPIRYHRDFGKTLYYFGRSRKFYTFKYPFVWYNAFYLADVLTRFEFLKDEELVRELVEWVVRGQDEQGRYKPTSMFMEYKSWDFSNKKEDSPWITFLACRVLKQYYSHS